MKIADRKRSVEQNFAMCSIKLRQDLGQETNHIDFI
jgi:hypothetical protein